MSVVYAVSASLLFGSADYLGGTATRYSSPWVVLVYSQLFGIVLGIAAVVLLPGGQMTMADAVFGALAGLAGAVGLATLSYSLAHTVVSVASPVAAVFGAAVPLVFGLAVGESTDAVGAAGMAIAFVAIVLVSGEPKEPAATPGHVDQSRVKESGEPAEQSARATAARRAAVLGALAGIGFGAFFIAISQTGRNSGLGPLVVARAVSIIAVVMLQVVRKGSFRLDRASRRPTFGAGILDMAANIAFLLAVRSGLIIVVTLITSTYPAMTVGLSRMVDKEQLGVRRAIGLASAIVAVALIGVSGVD